MAGVSVLMGRLAGGALSDKLPAAYVAAAFFLLAAAGIAVLGAGRNSMAPLSAVTLGLGLGAETDILAYLVSRYFPLSDYGRASGIIFGISLIGSATAPMAAGFLFDASGSYASALLLSAGELTIAAVLLPLLLPRAYLVEGSEAHD